MSLTSEEKQALISEVGSQAANKVNAELAAHNKKMEEVLAEAKANKGLSEESFEAYKKSQEELSEKLERIAKEQGKTLSELKTAVQSAPTKNSKSIEQVLTADKDRLAKIYNEGHGSTHYLVTMNKDGETVATQYNPATGKVGKAAYAHGTIDDIGHNDNVSSIAQNLNAATLLRVGGDAEIINQYRNNPYLFDLTNTITTSPSSSTALWINEVPTKEGGSSTVAEGGTKPLSQYFYKLESATYKKEATLLSFTEEFNMDFARLQQNAISAARIDLVNRINTAILANVTAAATAYNTGTEFKAAINLGTSPNDFDAIAAMAAQVDSATFGAAQANAALMSTYKKYGIGLTKDEQKAYLNSPDVLSNLAYIGNPAMGADKIIVGDFKQYNVLLRGGMIMKIGYNGTDFAQNKFSVVLEQFYFDYISDIRKVALVKGPDFADVKSAIATA